MKKLIIALSLAMAAGAASYNANASFFDFGDDDGCEWKMGPNGPWCDPDDNDWPEWTPMYWMEEMADSWDDDDDDDYWRYGPRPYYGGGYGGGYAPAPGAYAPAPQNYAPYPAPAAPAAPAQPAQSGGCK